MRKIEKIETKTVLASSGAATISVGIQTSGVVGGSVGTDAIFFLPDTNANAFPFTSVNSVTLGNAKLGKIVGDALVTVDIGAHALTAGKFNIIVAYYES